MENRRFVETAYLTHVCTNPSEVVCDFQALDEIRDQPKTKPIRLSVGNHIALSALHAMYSMMQEDENNGKIAQSLDVQFYAETTSLDKTFFENDTPIIGEHLHQTYLWKTVLRDSMETESVRIWNKAGMELFGMSARNMQDEWEAGLQNETRQD